MRIQFVTSVAAMPRCFNSGEEVDLPEVEARAWVAAGHAVPARKAETKALSDQSSVEQAVSRKGPARSTRKKGKD